MASWVCFTDFLAERVFGKFWFCAFLFLVLHFAISGFSPFLRMSRPGHMLRFLDFLRFREFLVLSRLARVCTDSVRLRTRRYLHHTLTTRQTRRFTQHSTPHNISLVLRAWCAGSSKELRRMCTRVVFLRACGHVCVIGCVSVCGNMGACVRVYM